MPTAEAFIDIVAAITSTVVGVTCVLAMRAGPLRPGRAVATLVTLLALLSITLIRLPYLFRYTPTAGLATLIPFGLAIVWMLTQPRRPVYRPLVMWLLGFICLFAIALFRGKAAGVGIGGIRDILVQIGTVVTAFSFGLLLFATSRTTGETRRRVTAVALAPAAYVCANLVLRIAGVTGGTSDPNDVSYAAGTQAKILGLAGIHIRREAFAMNSSINGMGVIAAIGFASAALLAVRTNGAERRAGTMAAIACLAVLLLADTRAALVIAIVVVGALVLLKRTRIALFLAIVIPFSSWISQVIISPLPGSTVGAVLSRNTTDVATGNGRTVIWDAAQRQLAKSDLFHLLMGFGSNGQATSGASRGYAYLFQDVPHPLLVHVHNLGLQMLLDMGVIGLLVLVIAVVLAIGRLEAINKLSPQEPVAALLAGALVLFITGTTEPSPTYRTQEAMAFGLLLLAACAGLAVQPVEAREPNRQRERRFGPLPGATPRLASPVS